MSIDMSSLPRARQREIGALKIMTDRTRAYGDSTIPLTVHCDADTIEWLTIVGGDVFRDYPAKTRRRMASEGSALPDGSYPVANCSDAEDAIRSIGRAGPGKHDKVVAHIRKRVKALGCQGTIFDKYK